MYKSMENHLDERFAEDLILKFNSIKNIMYSFLRFGPVEDFFRDDYFLASITNQR